MNGGFLPVCSITDLFRGKNPDQRYILLIRTRLVAKKILEILLPGVLAVIAYADNDSLVLNRLAISPFRIF
jgi:hypothetical protein